MSTCPSRDNPAVKVAKELGAKTLIIVGGEANPHDGLSLIQDLETMACRPVKSWMKALGEEKGRHAVVTDGTIALFDGDTPLGEYDLQGRKTYDPPQEETPP